ncbi:aminotransferase class V-fold PLP-dependent enzyme [Algisphaera agarilytica]|uniref:Cysteine desulfurase n=1 Tax=Algisphaera agarilytica TaxID=1385975 RepID=A0A7X0H853_9BACT|nr:SufS family cysteine desulfurase [Algisphaera agarilytica]MBB6429876.1 cysteine desulfurase/selenocysteine lyase [Algisphaera agarilytica]
MSDLATPTNATPSTGPFDVQALRSEFPILQREVHGKPLVYLDNAATKQKPQAVLDALETYYTQTNSNVHRGLHTLSEEATAQYEQARAICARFIGSDNPREIVFTGGATDALNLVAHSYGGATLKPGDRVFVTEMEHHSNIVPWQLVAERCGAEVVPIPVTDDGEIDLDAYRSLLDERGKVVAMVAVSNTLGTVNPVAEMVRLAKEVGAATVVDATQAVTAQTIDVHELGCDFLAFTGHKLYGPTGIGVFWGRMEMLEAMPPYRGGGEMIDSVKFTGSTYAAPPMRFEAGTPNIAGAIGLGVAIEWFTAQDRQAIWAHEHSLAEYGQAKLAEVEGLRMIGTSPTKIPIFSFVLDWAHAYDVGPVLDHRGIAVRTGHHCTEPLMDRFGVPATVRASCAAYTTHQEIGALVEALGRAKELLA